MGYSNSDIGHNWAHQLKKRQGGSNSMSFDGNKVYSYSTCIGAIVEVKDQKIYLLNTGRYSNSTGKHQSYAFRAIPDEFPQFSISCDDFIYGWSGYGSEWNPFNEGAQMQLVHKYLEKVFGDVKEFKTSKSVTTERFFSVKWFNEAKRFMDITKCTTMSKLLKEKASDISYHYHLHNMADSAAFRKMLEALNSGETRAKELVIATFGSEVWDDYMLRTSGARSGERTRRLNIRLGFNVSRSSWLRNSWLHPYKSGWERGYKVSSDYRTDTEPRNRTYINWDVDAHRDTGMVTAAAIRKHQAQGDLIKWFYGIKRDNLQFNLEVDANNRKHSSQLDAKKRLEEFIGMRGWKKSEWDSLDPMKADKVYNGTVFHLERYHKLRELSFSEYVEFTKLEGEAKDKWIYDKRAWMLEILQEETREHEEREARMAADRLAYEEQKRQREAKREYIAQKKLEGVEGVRQLFHEGLVDISWSAEKTLFYGGNALLRYDSVAGLIRTSKGINITLDEAKRLWRIVSYWHENNVTFTESSEIVHGTTSDWYITRFQDDIMIAGCHAIHFNEMKLMAEQLGFIQKAA